MDRSALSRTGTAQGVLSIVLVSCHSFLQSCGKETEFYPTLCVRLSCYSILRWSYKESDSSDQVRLFGVVAEGEHGEVLLAHLMGLAHDEARHRGFLGAVCTTLETDELELAEAKSAQTRLQKGQQALRERATNPAGPVAAEDARHVRSAAVSLLSTAGAFPTRANKAPTLLVAKGLSLSLSLSLSFSLSLSLSLSLRAPLQVRLVIERAVDSLPTGGTHRAIRSGLCWAGGSQ